LQTTLAADIIIIIIIIIIIFIYVLNSTARGNYRTSKKTRQEQHKYADKVNKKINLNQLILSEFKFKFLKITAVILIKLVYSVLVNDTAYYQQTPKYTSNSRKYRYTRKMKDAVM
jgi:uncharacterized protein YpmB